MGQRLQILVQLALVVVVVGSVAAWVPDLRTVPGIWAFRIALPLASLTLIAIIVRVMLRKDLVPNLLAKQFKSYFERNGLSFVPVLTNDQGQCRFTIFFQNRYTGHCVAEIGIRPGGKTLSLKRHAVAPVRALIECPGAAYGVWSIEYPIPTDYRGKVLTYEIAGKTSYPAGAGKLVRFRQGLRVGAFSSDAGKAAVTVGLAAVGVIYFSKPARLKIRLPADAVDGTAPTIPRTEILWTADLPTGGFPVIAGQK